MVLGVHGPALGTVQPGVKAVPRKDYMRSVICACVEIKTLGTIAHAVSFATNIEDTARGVHRPQWVFCFPPDHGYQLGKQYRIEIKPLVEGDQP